MQHNESKSLKYFIQKCHTIQIYIDCFKNVINPPEGKFLCYNYKCVYTGKSERNILVNEVMVRTLAHVLGRGVRMRLHPSL